MFEKCQKYFLPIVVLALFVFTLFVFYLDYKSSNRVLTFAILNVGQGDALFIESPTGTQILIDGGPPRKILSELLKVMSPFDRSIDAIIITNPDQDHIGGFLDILKVYKVGYVFEPGTFNDSKTYQNLEQEIKDKKIPQFLAKKGMRLDIGGGAVIDILFPDRDVSTWPTNDGSVVARLSYGNNSIMLTGDAVQKTEKIILKENPIEQLQSTILKVGHHGSYTSSGESFVKAISPQYAVISVGKENKYGHPHIETLNTLAQLGVKVLRTDLLGTVIFSCDRIKLCKVK